MKLQHVAGLLMFALIGCVGRIQDVPGHDGGASDVVRIDAASDSPVEAGCGAGLVACAGHCVDITRDNANCGACGMACAGATTCNGGMCRSTCATGQTACGTPSMCVTLQSDPANCGACGHACAAGEVCSAGACGTTCANTMCGASCVDLQTDPSHCGACGTACVAGQTCSAGHCGCTAGLMSCGSACVDTATDGANCGTCGHACGAGQTCVAGACACGGGAMLCGTSCVNTGTDTANCGSCGHACGAGQMCAAGVCGCPSGQMLCGTSCVNTGSDTANCGSCGHACAAGQVCSAGTCSTTCTMTMCGTACVNLQTDPMHCGACATVCPSGQSCVTGACTVSCAAGQMNCSGTCVNTATSATNCGSCGHACAAGQTCVASVCTTPTACPGPPAGVTADQTAALTLENTVRTAMGIPCATMVTTANLGATRHCAYYVADHGVGTCTSNPHVEVSTCSMYVAANFWDRMTAAGYTGSPAFEDMAFSGNGTSAVQQWIDSIWHRTPVLSPWVRDIGYGNGTGCDTMDFGSGASTPSSVVATYPYANQTNVPVSFNGLYEGPMPPAPPSGWPSGYPIHIYLQGGSISSHVLTLSGSTTPIAHMWIGTSDAAAMGLLPNANVMYANAPLTAATRYHVHIVGTNLAGPVTLDWDFTTR